MKEQQAQQEDPIERFEVRREGVFSCNGVILAGILTFEVLLCFSCARIQIRKYSATKQTINFKWPNDK